MTPRLRNIRRLVALNRRRWRRERWPWQRQTARVGLVGCAVALPLRVVADLTPTPVRWAVALAIGLVAITVADLVLGYLRLRALRGGLRRPRGIGRLPICKVCGFPGEGPCDVDPAGEDRDVEGVDTRRGRTS